MKKKNAITRGDYAHFSPQRDYYVTPSIKIIRVETLRIIAGSASNANLQNMNTDSNEWE
jgi:hypothetical protein